MRPSTVCLLVVITAGCSPSKPPAEPCPTTTAYPSCPDVYASSSSSTPMFSEPTRSDSTIIRADAMCTVDASQVAFWGIFEETTEGEPSWRTHRFAHCMKREGVWECDGTFLRMNNIDQKRVIMPIDQGTMSGLTVASVTGSVAVVRWGAHTFIVDDGDGEVKSVAKGAREIRGTLQCK